MSQVFEIRDYVESDAAICHDLRRRAFLNVFSKNLTPAAVEAGANSYDATQFGQRIGTMETCVGTAGGNVIGFCTIRVDSPAQAEVLYLYVDSQHRGSGVGSQLLHHAEQRVLHCHPKLARLYVDTAVPGYNQIFWERMGYRYIGPSTCDYPSGTIPANRLEKTL